MENLGQTKDIVEQKAKGFFRKLKALKIVKWFLIVFVLLFAFLLVLPNFIPTDTYRTRIENLVSEKTGGELKIKGDLRFSIVPYLGARANDIEFTLQDKEVKLDYARVQIKLIPLLFKTVKLDEFLVKDLYLKADVLPMKQLHISKLDAEVSMTQLNNPIYLGINTTINKEDFKGKLMIDNIDDLLANKESEVNFDFDSDLLQILYKGDVLKTVENEIFTTGKLTFEAKNVLAIMGFVNYKPALAPVKYVKLDTDLSFTPKVIELKNAKMEFDDIDAGLDLYSKYSQKKPYVKLDFALLDDLDLNNFINGCPIPDLSMCTMDCDGKANICLEDYPEKMEALEKQGEKDRDKMILLIGKGEAEVGKPTRFEWDKTPIDFSFMDMADADVTVKTKKIIYQNIHIDSYDGSMSLNNKKLKAITNRMEAYKAVITAEEGLDANFKIPTMYSKFNVKGLNIDELVEDFVVKSNKRFGGIINTSGNITTKGRSVYEIVQNLNGNAKFSLDDVVYRGADLEALFSDWPKTPGDWRRFADKANSVDMSKQTKISDISGSTKIVKGVVYNSDLKGTAPFMSIGGKGKVNLPKYTIDYKAYVEPKEDFAGDSEDLFKGFKIPVEIKGRLDNPKISVDASELVEEATKAIAKEFERKAKEELKAIEDKAREDLKAIEDKAKEDVKQSIDDEIDETTDKIKDEIRDFLKF